ncbi:small integral membrane protein 29-like isoform X2 [Adelges cooleyi]|uniref:small integral membrane protein 29-like isoform X2 n=1 Tax=Adelges cooleyi TaxID=133065 RepID=UPI00217FFF9D|nr:small integral membrane protein 29-like isoform X2 [Adelges cooleyi]
MVHHDMIQHVANLTDAHNVRSTVPTAIKSSAIPHPPMPFNLLTVIIIVVIFFLVFLVVLIAIQRKRRLDRLRHSLIPFYSFDANEEEDWDSDLLNNENGSPTIRSYGSVELNMMYSDSEKNKKSGFL